MFVMGNDSLSPDPEQCGRLNFSSCNSTMRTVETAPRYLVRDIPINIFTYVLQYMTLFLNILVRIWMSKSKGVIK